jgi:rod shape-determining protein MreC
MRKGGKAPKNQVPAELFVFVVLVAVSFTAILVSTRTLLNDFRDAGFSLFAGVRSRIHDVSSFVSRTVLSVQELAKLREEYAELQERVARYERLERSAAEINQENTRLREQLAFSQGLSYRHIPAELVGRDPDNLFSALIINKGRRAGITKDMAVVAWQSGSQALVGKVIQVNAFESMVMPLYDSSLLVASRFAASRYEGITEGQGAPDSPLRMRFIPKRAMDEISRGDMVVSSGMGSVYPPGLNIGRVSNVTFREHETTMEVEVEAIIDFSRLEYVFVIEKIQLQDDSDEMPVETMFQQEAATFEGWQ